MRLCFFFLSSRWPLLRSAWPRQALSPESEADQKRDRLHTLVWTPLGVARAAGPSDSRVCWLLRPQVVGSVGRSGQRDRSGAPATSAVCCHFTMETGEMK